MTSSNSNIHVSAIENARQRHQKQTLQNPSPLNYLKRKVDVASDDNAFTKSAHRRRVDKIVENVCDQFKEPHAIYSTHRSNSSKFPHNNNKPTYCSNFGTKESLATFQQ
jgi:hypothetical protein